MEEETGAIVVGSHVLRLNKEVADTICEALRVAVPFKYAAERAGISYDTFKDWRDKGKKALESQILNETDALFAAFESAVRQARAEAVFHLTNKALEGGKGSSNATFILERRFRDEYGDSRKVELTGKGGGPIQAENVTMIPDEQLKKLAFGDGID